MGVMASQIISPTIVYSTVYSRRKSKKISKIRVTCLCDSPVTGEFPAHRTSNAENVSIRWRHHYWDLSFDILYSAFSWCPFSWQFAFLTCIHPMIKNVVYSTIYIYIYIHIFLFAVFLHLKPSYIFAKYYCTLLFDRRSIDNLDWH